MNIPKKPENQEKRNKRKDFPNILILVIGLIAVGGLCYFAYLLIALFVNALSKVNGEYAIVVIGAVLTIVSSVVLKILSHNYEKRNDERRSLRGKKEEVYKELIEFFFKVIASEKLGKKPPNEQDINLFMNDFTQKLIIWGSDKVVNSFIIFRNRSLSGIKPERVLFLFEALLLEIRKDFGHKNKGIKQGDILSLFITDIDKYRNESPDSPLVMYSLRITP